MGRRIVTQQLEAAPAIPSVDGYFDKLIKYIPADIIAAWTAATGLIAGASSNDPVTTLLWVSFAVGLALTAAWTWRMTQEPGKPAAVTQIAVSTVAFGVWVFALGGPFTSLEWYSPLIGSLVLIGFTLGVPLISPQEG